MADKIGEGALVAIKKQNTAVVQFKVPDIPKTRKFQKKILTEEQYVEVRNNATCGFKTN